MERIDINGWKRKAQYELFRDYRVPTYSVTARLDVTPLVRFHARGGKLFDAMLYTFYKGMSSVKEMRMRMDDEGVVLYDTIYPVFTVALDDDHYASCRMEPCDEYEEFSRRVRLGIEKTKSGERRKSFDDGRFDDFYFSCVPILDFTGIEQPISADPRTASVPMAVWGRVVQNGEKHEVSLQITVHHALVDGMPLARVFAAIEREIKAFEDRGDNL